MLTTEGVTFFATRIKAFSVISSSLAGTSSTCSSGLDGISETAGVETGEAASLLQAIREKHKKKIWKEQVDPILIRMRTSFFSKIFTSYEDESFSSLNSMLSTSACQLASMIFSETPTVPHFFKPSPDSIKTRTFEPVPSLAAKTRTL